MKEGEIKKEEIETMQKPKRQINCDEVAWLVNALKRLKFIVGLDFPAISRIKEMSVYSALYEIMEILNLEFKDETAKHNATPEEVRKVPEDKTESEDDGNLEVSPN